MKKIAIWLLLACLLCGFAAAESDDEAARAQRHEWVECMLRAATGAVYADESALRADMTDIEIEQRRADLAAYRADTEIWLLAAFNASAENVDVTAAWARFQENKYGRAWLDVLRGLGAETAEDGLRVAREICAEWLAEIDAARLTEINADYACWIYAPDSPIDYPIVHGADNETYLHRMFDGTRNAAGTLFIDCRNLPDFQDPNTLIYGHHMRNDSMFGTLDHYAQAGYYDAHPWLLLIAPDQVDLLDVIAGYTTSDKDHCYDIAISDEDDKRAFVDQAIAKSDFISSAELQEGDSLVTLSTCAYAFEHARYIIICKRSAFDPSNCRAVNDELLPP